MATVFARPKLQLFGVSTAFVVRKISVSDLGDALRLGFQFPIDAVDAQQVSDEARWKNCRISAAPRVTLVEQDSRKRVLREEVADDQGEFRLYRHVRVPGRRQRRCSWLVDTV